MSALGREPGGLFPPIDDYAGDALSVGDGHTVWVAQAGNPDGAPVLFLHGGPGSGCSPSHRRLFDPRHYRVILPDQRGAGRSTPHASLHENTTWKLIADLETVRERLGIARWMVFGGSWGSTLALAYAQTHPERVSGLILRGIFLCREAEIRWFYQPGGCSWIFPDEWARYEAVIPSHDRGDMVAAYYRRLTHADPEIQLAAARAWSGWEHATCKLLKPSTPLDDATALAMARIECHYFVNQSFFPEPDYLLRNVDRIRHLPTWIIHGRYDVVCPFQNAWDLHQALPQAHFAPIADAGHAYDEPGILAALIAATEAAKAIS
ncbi:MAG: prolyl aminopeptidase [Vampirovibrionales bacterium]|nr:prolyl aminopeptidase [Vampirovibrionales bacterium]